MADLQAKFEQAVADSKQLPEKPDNATLKATRWGGYAGYDSWFAGANNASFAVLASYTGLVPAFQRIYEREGRDFTRFYAEVRRIAALPAAERSDALAR